MIAEARLTAPAPTQPIFGGDVESHHVKHSPPTEIKL
jgi:hypothetical protein